MSVVIYHFGDVYPFNSEYLAHFFSHSDIFVSYFFFLSGFVLFVSYYNKKNSTNYEFWIKRVARIYPLYLLALLFFIILVIPLWGEEISLKELTLNLLLLQSWNHDTALSLNYPGWSLSVEMFFYLTFPFILQIAKKLSINKNIIICLIIWISSQLITIFYFNKSYNPLIHINCFWGGLALAKALTENKKSKLLSFLIPYAGVLLTISTIAFILIVGTPNTIIKYGHNGLLTPIYALFTFGLIYSKNVVTQVFSNSSLVYLGNISYGVYILQFPVAIFATNFVRFTNRLLNYPINNGPIVEFYVFIMMLIVCSALAYSYIEKPAKKIILSIAKV